MIVEIDIGGAPQRVEVDSDDPAVIDDVAKHLAAPTATSTTSTPVTAGATGGLRGLTADQYTDLPAVGKLGVAAYDKFVHPVAESAGRLVSGESFGGGVMSTLGDVANVAKALPVMAPFTAVNIAADTATGTATGDRPTASTVGNVTELGASLGGMVRSGAGAVASRLRAPAKIAEEAGSALGGIAPEVAGQTAKAGVRSVASTMAAKYGPMFDEVKAYAEANKSALPAGHPLATQLSQSIDTLTGAVGQFLTGKDRAAIDVLKTAVTNGQPVPYSVLDDVRGFLNSRIPVNPGDRVMYKFLGRLRAEVGAAMGEAVTGTPVADTLKTARSGWKTFVAPASQLAGKLEKLTDVQAFERAVGSLKDPARASQARTILGEGSPEWAKLRGGFFEKLVRGAGGDADKLLRMRAKVAPEVWNMMTGGGPAAESFFSTLADATKAATKLKPSSAQVALGGAAATLEGARQVSDMFSPVRDRDEAPSVTRAMMRVALAGAGGYGLASAAGRLFVSRAIASPGAINTANLIRRAVPGDADVESLAGALDGQKTSGQGADMAPPADGSQTGSNAQPEGFTTRTAEGGTLPLYDAVGKLTGLDPAFLKAVAQTESGERDDATGPLTPHSGGENATGRMQMLPATFEGYRQRVESLVGRAADIRNPLDNMLASGLMYRELLDANNGDVAAAARGYHGGPDVRIHGPKTRAYGNVIAARYAQLASGG